MMSLFENGMERKHLDVGENTLKSGISFFKNWCGCRTYEFTDCLSMGRMKRQYIRMCVVAPQCSRNSLV